MSNKLIATLLLVLTCVGIAYSGIITRPTKTTGGTSYTDGTIPHASDFNGDVDTVYNLVNGNIEDANVKGSAAIAGSKINTLFTSNVQVTSASSPCFINHDSSQGLDLKQWRICQSGGTLNIATYTDAGAVIITPLSIARATGLLTSTGGLTLSAGNLTITSLTAKSFLFSGVGGLLTTTAAPTNGQMLIGNTGNSPTLGTIAGTATHVCTATGAGTFTLDFCPNPAITAPVFAGTATGSLTSLALTTPVLTGTVTGTYTLGGTPTFGAGSAFTTPVFTGSITGTYSLDGTPSVGSTLTLTNGQLAFPAAQNASAGVNTLDDYEEGTWTPVLTFSTPGNLSVGYSIQAGAYVKVGSTVTVWFNIVTSSFTQTTASGDLLITGLPFTSKTTAVVYAGSLSSFQGVTKASYTQFNPSVDSTATQIRVFASASAQNTSTIAAADMPTGTTKILVGSVTYQAVN